jgi:hypothetical protein
MAQWYPSLASLGVHLNRTGMVVWCLCESLVDTGSTPVRSIATGRWCGLSTRSALSGSPQGSATFRLYFFWGTMSFIREVHNLTKVFLGAGEDTNILFMKEVIRIAEKGGLSTMQLVLAVNEEHKRKTKEEMDDYRQGLSIAFDELVGVMRDEEAGRRKSKHSALGILMSPDRVAMSLYYLRPYLKDPKKASWSNNTEWLVKWILKHMDFPKYLEGGDSHDWAVRYGHLDYIKALKEIKDNPALMVR